jgi:hypothetical protein
MASRRGRSQFNAGCAALREARDARHLLSRIGIDHFDVDASGFDVDAKATRTRRDSGERLRETHEAAAFDKWSREQVQESLDDPRPNVSDAEVKADIAARRAKLLKQIKGDNS